ncbi:tRNA lysidine(34) synthetase TilS [Sphingomonas changnyeongensis]|uniref:tRNA(Ile)-lysidine synthase n=1 Tax=Sphingomonas changnyeongensis TaxID=2698679 RepID=A0A7Z2NVT7_9SPHN|nr:tRNA lysidine(34) synthetase TilS [Sphingomonas changnyeongensis]QHL90756.1 tRNA lysidine(34) synthetase TilS [Sphingomonas changnyeongensis]
MCPILSAVTGDARIGIAVSGGPDSLALLLLAAAERPGQVRAATVDHGLRAEAAAEAAAVGAVCARLGVAHDVLQVRVAGSVQAGARDARYQALAGWAADHGLSHVATAHHADDQAETLVMRLARGAGLAGLAGIRRERPLAPGITLIRPVLDWRRAELRAVVDAAGIMPAADPSNDDPRFDRTHARRLMAAVPWLDPARLAHSAAILAEAEAALDWAAARLADERIAGDTLDPRGLPPELVRRLVLRLLAAFGIVPDGPRLARLIARLDAGRTATIGTVKALPGPVWRFMPAPPRRPGGKAPPDGRATAPPPAIVT